MNLRLGKTMSAMGPDKPKTANWSYLLPALPSFAMYCTQQRHPARLASLTVLLPVACTSECRYVLYPATASCAFGCEILRPARAIQIAWDQLCAASCCLPNLLGLRMHNCVVPSVAAVPEGHGGDTQESSVRTSVRMLNLMIMYMA